MIMHITEVDISVWVCKLQVCMIKYRVSTLQKCAINRYD